MFAAVFAASLTLAQMQQQAPAYQSPVPASTTNAPSEFAADPMEAPLAASRVGTANGGGGGDFGEFDESSDPNTVSAAAHGAAHQSSRAAAPPEKSMGKTGGRMGKNISSYNDDVDSDEEFDISTDDLQPDKPMDEKEAESSSFKPGEHPLDGIPGINASDMPTPDPLPSTGGEGYPMDVLGPYIIRCLCSKNWSLREAALAKCCVLISGGEVDVCKNVQGFCNLIKAGLSDTISHVLLTALNVLQVRARAAPFNERANGAFWTARGARRPLFTPPLVHTAPCSHRVHTVFVAVLTRFRSCRIASMRGPREG